MHDYSDYLMTRSLIAFWYRKYVLYPKLRARCIGRILDFGCGIGDFVVTTKNCVGYDSNELLEKIVISRGGRFIRHDGLKLDHYDTIVLDNVLEHIADLESFFTEMVSQCKVGCTFIIGIPLIKGYISDIDHKYYVTSGKLEQMFERIGIVELDRFSSPLNIRSLDEKVRQGCFYMVGQLNA